MLQRNYTDKNIKVPLGTDSTEFHVSVQCDYISHLAELFKARWIMDSSSSSSFGYFDEVRCHWYGT